MFSVGTDATSAIFGQLAGTYPTPIVVRDSPTDARKVVERRSKESVDPRDFEATLKLIGRPQACRSRLSLKCIEFKQ
jgi:hypothetical protein